MFRNSRIPRTILCSAVLLMLASSLAFAGTGSTNVSGGGSLSWTWTFSTGNCFNGGQVQYSVWSFSSFVYTDTHGVSTNVGLGGAYINSPGGNMCPPNGPQPVNGAMTTFSSGQTNYTLTFFPQSGGSGSATITTTGYSGYVNPKYIILGVTYAPPGPSSSVSYTNATTVSSTNSISDSFTNAFMSSLTTKANAGLLGWKAGVSFTVSAGYSQTSTSTNSLELDETTSRSYSASGASNPYVGINHDYDIVWLWLNPVELFTLNTNAAGTVTSTTWNGHGISTLDQPVADVYPAYVGWLNGDIPMTPSQAAPFKRTWAAGENWPTGQGPGITGPGAGTDFANIEQVDPYWSCSTPTHTTCPTTIDLTRYTLTPNNADFLYIQAPVGGTPLPTTYMEGYTTISSIGQSGAYEKSVKFAFEKSFSGSLFFAKFSTTLNVSDELTFKHTYDHKLATTNSSQATLVITGPPCVVVSNNCSPVYTKSTQFDLYEDNLYGTFFLNPVN